MDRMANREGRTSTASTEHSKYSKIFFLPTETWEPFQLEKKHLITSGPLGETLNTFIMTRVRYAACKASYDAEFSLAAGYLKQFSMQTAMQCDVMHRNLIVVAYANLYIYF
jgi:hypothetical protein